MLVPPDFFRLSLERGGRRVTGASIAGLPGVALGSNGHVAWGATNDVGDWTDLILLDLDPNDPNRYRTPDGWKEIETVSSRIEVARGEPRELAIRTTIWGPVLGELPDGTPYVRQLATRDDIPFVSATALQALAAAEDVSDVAMLAPQILREPLMNLVAGDVEGHIMWTIPGPIPRRVRHDLVSHSSEGPAWDGWLEPEEYPLIVDPPQGRIWTANNRVVDGEMLEKIGNGRYRIGARARQIRDRLLAIENATPADMLRVQLDDEALFLVRWRDHFLALLEDADDSLRVAAREAIRDWGGHASIDSVGFFLVWNWRAGVIVKLADALTAEVKAAYPAWEYTDGYRAEHWVWPLITQQPAHLLPPGFDSWRAVELAAMDELFEMIKVASPADLAEHTLGRYNTVRLRHPLSRGLPFLGSWLDMPPVQLPGAPSFMPRIQSGAFGASLRFAVSPGDEEHGYFHMAGGQSGHPLSPYYGAGQGDWEQGRPTPFLPGPAEATLTLLPASEPQDR